MHERPRARDLVGGVGGLLVTEVERTSLGSYGRRTLHGRVERRSLRLALGSRRGMRLQLTRMRPVAVEVSEPERNYEVPINVPPDPRMVTVRRLLWTAGASLAVTILIGRLRGRRRRGTVEESLAATGRESDAA